MAGYFSGYVIIGNRAKGGGRVACWGYQLGFGVGGGAGINYGYSGYSLSHIKSIINGD